MTSETPIWKRTLGSLGSLKLTVLGLALLTILTVWGTLYQADFGLYRAQLRFYQSWFFLGGGWLPFPGAQSVMLLLIVNLVCSMVYLVVIGKSRVAFFLTHGGLLLMLLAGAVTFYYGSESQLTLEEGEGANVSAAYYDWELAAWPGAEPFSDRGISAIDIDALRPGRSVRFDELALELSVESVFGNSEPESDTSEDRSLVSGSSWTGLTELPAAKEPSMDRPGAIVKVQAEGGSEARLLIWGGDTRPVRWSTGGNQYAFSLRRERVPLPAEIHLIDFTKSFYPGSQIAKSFSSKVRLEDSGVEREVLISMNKPLRHKGFTFYQSSYRDLPGGRETSTLAVVKNYGRVMPYIATAVTVIGMTIHFVGLLVLRLARQPRKQEANT